MFLIWSFSGDKQPSYKHFPAVGAFSYKFLIALAAKLLIGSKKLGGAKMTWTSYYHAKYGGDRGSRAGPAGCRWKSVMFFVCSSRFRITKFVIMETLSSSVIFKNNYGAIMPLHRGRFIVVLMYSSFLWTPMIFPKGKVILTRSSADAERMRDASCLYVVSFNIPKARFFITSYCGFRFTSA